MFGDPVVGLPMTEVIAKPKGLSQPQSNLWPEI